MAATIKKIRGRREHLLPLPRLTFVRCDNGGPIIGLKYEPYGACIMPDPNTKIRRPLVEFAFQRSLLTTGRQPGIFQARVKARGF